MRGVTAGAGPALEVLLRDDELVLARRGPGRHVHAAGRLPGVEPRVVRYEILSMGRAEVSAWSQHFGLKSELESSLSSRILLALV